MNSYLFFRQWREKSELILHICMHQGNNLSVQVFRGVGTAGNGWSCIHLKQTDGISFRGWECMAFPAGTAVFQQ